MSALPSWYTEPLIFYFVVSAGRQVCRRRITADGLHQNNEYLAIVRGSAYASVRNTCFCGRWQGCWDRICQSLTVPLVIQAAIRSSRLSCLASTQEYHSCLCTSTDAPSQMQRLLWSFCSNASSSICPSAQLCMA